MMIFTLFILVLLLLIGGLAVDTMRFETRRVAMQNTMDNAVLAASSLDQDLDAEKLIREYVALAGFDPSRVKVRPKDERINGGQLVSRTVEAAGFFDTNTFFMQMVGIDNLPGGAVTTASEGVQNIEISLIVDISGSMGNNDRLVNLKIAAKEFFKTMLDSPQNIGTTTISIIPYNATVVVGQDIIKHLNASGTAIPIDTDKTYPNMLPGYRTVQTNSSCVRFSDNEFKTRDISPQTPLDRVSHFKRGDNDFKRPTMNQRWCNEKRSSILVHSNKIDTLNKHIEGLSSGGWTGIDNGMKWGVALLDPAFSPVVKAMIADKTLPADIDGRPGKYDTTQTQKIIVLMTDGANTHQRDLKDEFKNGDSRIWYLPAIDDGEFEKKGEYFVLMPDNDPAERWFKPGLPDDTSDDSYIAETAIPADAFQLDYIALHERFSVKDIANYFFKGVDTVAFNAHNNGEYKTEEGSTIDDRLRDICTAAKKDRRITVYTIGFEAPPEGQTAMANCATAPGYYYPTNGKGISGVFASIAAQISKLRLTN